MKALKAILAVMIIALVAVSFGCSKKSNPAAPAEPATQLPAAQQGAVATMGQDMALSATSNISTVQGFMDGVPKGGPKAPPAGWYGPDGDGWYQWYYGGDSLSYTYTYYLRLTPDVWGSGMPPVTKAEWKMTYQDTISYHMWYYARCENQSVTDTTHVKGVWEFHITNIYSGYDLSYNWVMNFTNVSKASNDYSGNYTYSFSYPTYGTGGLIHVSLAGAFNFVSDGSGSGNMTAGGTEIVRYTFYAHDANPRGYYTLASENWGTQHTFSKK